MAGVADAAWEVVGALGRAGFWLFLLSGLFLRFGTSFAMRRKGLEAEASVSAALGWFYTIIGAVGLAALWLSR